MADPVFVWTGVLLLTASAACCIALVLNRKKVFPRLNRGIQRKEASRSGTGELSVIADGIQQYAPEFDGLYEGLYQSAQNHQIFSTDAYQEWCERVGQINDEPFHNAFGSMFAKSDIADEALCREKYALLLRCVSDAGIRRDRSSGVCCVADETMHKAYVEAGNQKPKIGGTYTVIKAAWLSNEKVIEYGMVMPGSVNI